MDRTALEARLADGRSIESIARETGRAPSTVAYWVNKYGGILRECDRHGWGAFLRVGAPGHYRCARCNTEAVSDRRRRVKEILVAEAGGRCLACGFDAYAGALQFHHRDPATKAFEVSRQGVTRSLKRLRLEAQKCVLLCANCHAMVEAGLLSLPVPADDPG